MTERTTSVPTIVAAPITIRIIDAFPVITGRCLTPARAIAVRRLTRTEGLMEKEIEQSTVVSTHMSTLSSLVFLAGLSLQEGFQVVEKFRTKITILMAAANDSGFEIRKMICQVFRSRIGFAEQADRRDLVGA